MNVEIISIGDELLIGQVINTNCTSMAKMLNDKGFNVNKVTTIADDATAIETGVKEALQNSDCVLITGGLGPTKDDITKYTLAKIFGMSLIESPRVLENVCSIFEKRGYPMTETNRKQALVPNGCTVIDNPIGTAPGMCFEKDGKLVISMPGVPFEMENMMKERVLPLLLEHYKVSAIFHRTFITQGIGESFLSDKLEDFEAGLPSFIKLAYLPKPNVLRLRLSARGENHDKVKAELDNQANLLLKELGDYFIGFDEDNLAVLLSQILLERGESLATAESCTGGNIAHQITLLAGASQIYKGSVVSYSNEAKAALLGVKEETLKQYGAVSQQVAEQMALGAVKKFNTTYAVSTTGIAGPTGATQDKPVGTVWIAIANNKGKCWASKHGFFSSRENFINRATNECLSQLIRLINNKK